VYYISARRVVSVSMLAGSPMRLVEQRGIGLEIDLYSPGRGGIELV
jgi:hypothetical protein